jgi:LPXTG-motif cell wall-anchored protein
MHIRHRARKLVTMAGTAGLAATFALAVPLTGAAGASGTVTLNPTPPAGGYTNGQTITVSGTGFSTNPSDSIQIAECADPGGTTAGLPADNSTCDGTTLNPDTIFTNSAGTFSDTYQITKVTTATGSNINCDATDYCVLWVGEDFNNNFTGSSAQPTGFSQPFLIGSATTGAPESPLTVALPLLGAAVVGGGGFVAYRRRRGHAAV